MSLAQFWAIFRAYQREVALLFIGGVMLSLLIIWLLPRTFTATSVLLVNYEVNDPMVGREYPLGLLANYSATQIEIMRSPQVLLPVIDQLKLIEEEEFTAGYNEDKGTLQEWIRSALNEKLDIQQSVGGSQLINITASSKKASLAAAIANAVADVYLEQQVTRVNAPASHEVKRYETQIDDLRSSVVEAQDRLIKFREASGIVTTEGGLDVEINLLVDLETRLAEARKRRMAAEAKQSFRADIADEVLESPVVQNLKGQTATRQAELAQLRMTLGTNHLRIKQLESDIAVLQTAINAEIKAVGAGMSADLVSARDVEKRLTAAVAEQRERMLDVRRQEVEGAKFQLEFESVRDLYRKALDSFEQVKASAGGQYNNVSLLSSATVPFKPTRPNKLKLFGLAVAMSAGLAFGIPLLYELFIRRRIRCVDDVEHDLELPVLAEFLPAGASWRST